MRLKAAPFQNEGAVLRLFSKAAEWQSRPQRCSALRSSRLAALICLAAALGAAAGCGSDPGSNNGSTDSGSGSNFPPATVPLVKLSTDTFTNPTSQHATEVEPGSFAFGSTIITSFQVGRISGGGSADIGYALSTDGGISWQNGLLPGLTTFQGGGTNSAVSDTNVAYDAAHGVWLISSLPISTNNIHVAVSRSSDGGASWSNPIVVSQGANLDKTWLVCDSTSTSPHYGNCYMEWDDNGNGNLIWISTSTDGGLTWSTPATPGGPPHGLGGQPLVQPNGKVIVPYLADSAVPPDIQSFSSSDGGASWSGPVLIGTASTHTAAGGLRVSPLPSAQIDALGNAYVIWQDCSFRTNCTSNDLVMSISADGTTWTPPARIPIDPVTSTFDHFIPGLGIDPATAGGTAHLGLTYYYYPLANCTAANCALYVGFISSLDGGSTWSAATPIAGPMSLDWLPSTVSGLMVADYIATSFVNGKAYGFFAVAKAKSGSTFDEAIYTTQSGIDVGSAVGRNSSAGERPVSRAVSIRPPAVHQHLTMRR